MNSSPLASPSTPETPPAAARRRAQYKSQTPTTPTPRPAFNSRGITSSGGSVFASGGRRNTPSASPLDPQKAFLRERFRARCLERAAQARAKAIKGKRYESEPSSDGFDDAMDEDDEEDDEDIMHDELFRRIMANVTRKQKHSYRLSYAHEVGSSFDPDMENVEDWEHDLNQHHSYEEPLPDEFGDEDELAAYAAEYANQTVLADFEDIPEEELFDLSYSEEVEPQIEDIEMSH